MTAETTGIEIAEQVYPVVPDTDSVRVASEVFALMLTQVSGLYRDLSTVLAECEDTAPATVTHSFHLMEAIMSALIQWLSDWPESE